MYTSFTVTLVSPGLQLQLLNIHEVQIGLPFRLPIWDVTQSFYVQLVTHEADDIILLTLILLMVSVA